jgi:hypothetical protein
MRISPIAKAPVFVGGTGRSGTTKTAQMIGAHRRYAFSPIELGFHVVRGGLLDLVNGETSIESFSERMRTVWFARVQNRVRRGRQLIERNELDRAIERLQRDCDDDRLQAARRFMRTVMGPPLSDAPDGWVDSTPPAVKRSDGLLELFPDAGVINIVRDGRDVACSAARQTWGSSEPLELLAWWAREVKAAHEAAARAGSGRVLTVHLEQLAITDRERTFARLFRYLGVEPDERSRRFLERHILADRVHQGRWRTELPPERLAQFESTYEARLADLRAAGVEV